MLSIRTLALASFLAPSLLTSQPGAATPAAETDPTIAATNDNRSPAGRLRNGVLSVRLEARTGTWHPEEKAGPGLQVAAFAEEGRAPSVPGPLLRVPAGTEIRATVRNSLDKPLLLRGLHPHDGTGADSIDLAPGEVRELRFRATTPGTHFYWGRTEGHRRGLGWSTDGQLVGAFVVDPPGARTPPDDRILLISLWEDTVHTPGHHPHETIVVNGLSWPHTERLTYSAGDSVRWRVINASVAPHPMHLHGFYYQVDSRGDGVRDTVYTPEQRRTVVTEFMAPATTMAITWVPKRPGNWLFHCHLIAHVSTELRLGKAGSRTGPGAHSNHATDGMAALVTGIHVLPRPGHGVAEDESVPRRRVRAFINTRPNYFGSDPGIGFVLQEGPSEPAPDSMRLPGSPVVLTRDEPTEIVVHNRATEKVTVHWHGIELESYYDGVGDWSGDAMRVAPPIAPGDSFVVRFTPDRAGTFIYHTHMEEGQQLNSGLYGPLIVREPGAVVDTLTDRVLLLGWRGPGPEAPPALNGDSLPAPIHMQAGTTYRLRFINITPSSIERVKLLADSTPQQWTLFAKDGADLPLHQRRPAEAVQVLGSGETYDFEFTPGRPGDLVLQVEVGTRGRKPAMLRVPVHVR